jgi:hypothetical protein
MDHPAEKLADDLDNLPEAEFLDVTGTKAFFLLAIHSHLYNGIYSPLVCNATIVYGNLKSENSQDYAQKPQLNYTFMNSASGYLLPFGQSPHLKR